MLRLSSVIALPEPGSSNCDEALALFSVEGTLMRATPAMLRFLRRVPDLEPELKRFVRLRRNAAGCQQVYAELQANGETFIVLGTFMNAELVGDKPSVLVVVERAQEHEREVADLRQRFGFTNRQAEVALLIRARRSNLEIAEHFGISRHTARHHVQAVLTKLGVRSRTRARQVIGSRQEMRRTS